MYVSEVTRFLEALKDAHPEIGIEQRKGRAIWWDKKPMSAEELEHQSESHVRQNGYVYQTKL